MLSGECVVSVVLQYFEHVEEAEWAVQVLKTSGKPVAASLCIGPEGDMHGVSPGECAVRLVKAGTYFIHPARSHDFSFCFFPRKSAV